MAEVFALHREHSGLLHLDIKRPGIDRQIAQLLDRFDLWEHVISAPVENGVSIAQDPRYKPLKYKTQLYSDHRDVDPHEIETAIKLDGAALIVDDPRACIVAMKRTLGAPSRKPAAAQAASAQQESPVQSVVPSSTGDGSIDPAVLDLTGKQPKRRDAQSIRRRAELIDRYAALRQSNTELTEALRQQVADRSLHTDWRYHGLDGAAALRALVALNAPDAVELARQCLWRDDPLLDEVRDRRFNHPRSWHDWRMKNAVFTLLECIPGEATERICRDYLALSDAESKIVGPPQFESAASALFAVSPNEQTASELLKHRLAGVRNRTIKLCLQHADQPWAVAALKRHASYALRYIVPRGPELKADR